MPKDIVSDLFQNYFQRRKKDRKGMSVRTLARMLECSPSYAQHILKGTRKVSLQMAEKICEILDIDPEKRDQIYTQVLNERGATSEKAVRLSGAKKLPRRNSEPPEWQSVSTKDFHLLESRKAIAVLETIGLAGFDGSLTKVADRLGFPLETVERCVAQLENAKLLVRNEGGIVKKSAEFFDFSSSKLQTSIRQYHSDCLHAAIRELTQKTSESERDRRLISTILFGISQADLPALKQKLLSAMEEICKEFASDQADDVCQFSILAFPITSEKP